MDKKYPRPDLGRNPQKRDQNLHLQSQKSTINHEKRDHNLYLQSKKCTKNQTRHGLVRK